MRKIPALLLVIFIFACLVLNFNSSSCFAQTKPVTPEIAGEFFGIPVSLDNYYFAKRAVVSFAASWRPTPQTEAELEDMVWQELLFSYEAYRRGIKAEPAEIDDEIEKLLKAEKADFSFRLDKEKFQSWLKEKLNLSEDAFRNQISHLVQLEKLRKQVLAGFAPQATDEEAYQKFLDEHNTLLVELRQFDAKADADKFFELSNAPLASDSQDELIWEDLVCSYEASVRNITVAPEKVSAMIAQLLFLQDAGFNHQSSPEEYKSWIMDKYGISVEEFEKRMTQVLAIDSLREKVEKKEEKPFLDQEKYRKLRKANPALDKAYAVFLKNFAKKTDCLRFGSIAQAKEFYAKIKREAGYWESEKRRYPEEFKRPGFVALDFLIHMWQFQREDAYAMLEKPLDSYYPASAIYKGYGVFKILKIRKAEATAFDAAREDYRKKVQSIKRYELYQEWVKALKEQAKIKRFIK